MESSLSSEAKISNGNLRWKDISDWLKVVVLVFLAGGAWASVKSDLRDQSRLLKVTVQHGQMMERYLSSKDPEYWKRIKEMQTASPEE
jgi:hypothetical protein